MKLALFCIVIAGFAAAEARKCSLRGAQCVEVYTGPLVGPPGPKPQKPDCQKCRADAVARSVTDPKCFIPLCKPGKPREFQRKQYDPNVGPQKGPNKGQSFCYDRLGNEIKGTRVNGKGADCRVKPAFCGKAEPKIDRPGNDIKKHLNVPNFKACQAKCVATKGCVAITYVPSTKDCYTKNKVGKPVPNARTVSAVCPSEKPQAPKMGPCAFKRFKLNKKGNPFKIVPSCNKKGGFNPVQCWKQGPKPGQEWCWCSYENGSAIPATFYKKNTKSKKPNCKRHAAVKPKCKKGQVLIPYPGNFKADCGRYISCSPSRVFSCYCGKGQHFDFKNQECGWAKKVKCNKKN